MRAFEVAQAAVEVMWSQLRPGKSPALILLRVCQCEIEERSF